VAASPVSGWRYRAHNIQSLAAVSAALLFIPAEAIRRAAQLQVLSTARAVTFIDGVQFINDSQGTQPDAVIAALYAFERPLVLIAGGRDKGNDLSPLGPVVAERADAAVLIGESGPALAALFRRSGVARVELAQTGRRAAGQASPAGSPAGPAARSRATVLPSPAAALRHFADYAARGAAFRAAAEAPREAPRM
jgi:UDP-N-acetylmuramoylalanine--D-glutamate ligase